MQDVTAAVHGNVQADPQQQRALHDSDEERVQSQAPRSDQIRPQGSFCVKLYSEKNIKWLKKRRVKLFNQYFRSHTY